MKKKVLIVCHSYPPNPGVGGRRWAIFTKYLCRLGYEIHILTKQPKKNTSSPWINITKGATVHYYKNKYPNILESVPKTILQKLTYRLALIFVKAFSISNFYDRGVFLQAAFISRTKEILSGNKIENLIVTGAPFSFLFYGALMKKYNLKLNFIADIRDSWLSENYYGFGSLSTNRKEAELKRLKSVLAAADTVIVPYPQMKDEYKSLSHNSVIEQWPHAVDDELILPRKEIKIDELGDINIVNFGTHYSGLKEMMINMNKMVLNTKITINFYTQDYQYKHIFDNNVNIVYNSIVSQNKVFKILSESDTALFFITEEIKDYISTKYIETIASRTPIVIIGKSGKITRFVLENNLGLFIDDSEIESGFSDLRENLKNLNYNDKFDYSELTFRYQTNKLDALLK